MGGLDDLSPDQRAVVQLVLAQGRRYDELAALLGIEPDAVRARAEAALSALGRAAGAVEPPAVQRAVLTDWLLGQQAPATAQATAAMATADPARGWAAAIAPQLRPLGGDRVPPVPGPVDPPLATEPPPTDEPPLATEPPLSTEPPPATDLPLPGFDPVVPGDTRPASASRLGGALLILGVAVVVAVVLILVLRGGGDDTPTAAATAAGTTAATSTAQAQATIEGQVNLRAPGGGDALGVANIIAQGGQRALTIRAQGLEPNTKRDAYAVWLTGGSGGAVKRLGFAPAVGRNGRLEGVAVLPGDTAGYRRLELSLETGADPARPTDVVLRGRF